MRMRGKKREMYVLPSIVRQDLEQFSEYSLHPQNFVKIRPNQVLNFKREKSDPIPVSVTHRYISRVVKSI